MDATAACTSVDALLPHLACLFQASAALPEIQQLTCACSLNTPRMHPASGVADEPRSGPVSPTGPGSWLGGVEAPCRCHKHKECHARGAGAHGNPHLLPAPHHPKPSPAPHHPKPSSAPSSPPNAVTAPITPNPHLLPITLAPNLLWHALHHPAPSPPTSCLPDHASRPPYSLPHHPAPLPLCPCPLLHLASTLMVLSPHLLPTGTSVSICISPALPLHPSIAPCQAPSAPLTHYLSHGSAAAGAQSRSSSSEARELQDNYVVLQNVCRIAVDLSRDMSSLATQVAATAMSGLATQGAATAMSGLATQGAATALSTHTGAPHEGM